MALAQRRCAFRRLIAVALQLAVITSLFHGVARGAANKETVKYTLGDLANDVHYGMPFHILSSKPKEGGFRSGPNGDIQLTGQNDLGAKVQLVPVSGTKGLSVYANDTVYITSFDRAPPAINPGWGWRKQGQSQWVLTWILPSSSENLAKFRIIPKPGNSEKIVPPRFLYYLQSCPGDYCSGLTRLFTRRVTNVKLGGARSKYGDLAIRFFPSIK